MSRWTFWNYQGAAAADVIRAWFRVLPESHKAGVRRQLKVRLEYLAGIEQLSGTPYFKPLVGHDGLYELRMLVNNVQYRPICCYGPGNREVTILAVAEERGGKLSPRSATTTAANRMVEIRANRSYVTRHGLI